MNSQDFAETVSWAQARGMKLHPHMEHKCVDGIYGVYATADIPQYTELLRYPIEGTLPLLANHPYPQQCPELLKRLHVATLEYAKGEQSEWHGLMRSVESLESLKQTSAYFLTNNEMAILERMNPLLHRIVEERNSLVNQKVQALCQIDPSLDKASALVVTLNFKTRAWREGFLPIFDQFNTSEAHGAKVCKNGTHIYFITMRPYKAGEEIWISYGTRDIYDYAIDYDFFDPNATHSICFATRGSQFATTPFEIDVIKYAATKHKIDISQTPQGLHYQLMEDDARFLEHAPSSKMINYIQHTAFRSPDELKQGMCSPESFDIRLNQILDALLAVNQVDQFSEAQMTPKLLRFYHLLKKEKQLLLNNKHWAKFNSLYVNEIPKAVQDKIMQ
ncbi:MAG: SET domain-containing protein [Oleiphilaceae bacterium]|nr:SET domain-containing protein [Oleiphilaceae bacterium]